ncbi:MAG: molybdopterin-dependent oxidoreductase [Chloroflexi bacterium]|nr:molybdopterin-dependent oxidoreductase [Chloroflexota bacterium]
MAEFSLIGKSVPRVDGVEKVTGKAGYAADFSLPGMLWCKLVRSPYAHARIVNIDASRALRLPGVKAVVTGKDFGGWTWGWMPATRDEPPVAVDKVRYWAEAVAGIAAIDEDTAEEACDLVDVEYEELPGVFDPEEAMKDGAPAVHDYAENNISVQYHWNFGDVEKAFADAYIVREDRFATSRATKGYIEPPATLAYYDPSGYITVRAAKQSPYFHYRHLAACFKLPLSRVRVIQPYIGGGFGGTKNDSLAGDFCAVLLSKMTGKPVKYVESMEEELTTSRRRHNMITYSKMGATRDGIITAIQHKVIADGGGYTAVGPLSLYLAGFGTTLPYKLDNFKYDGYRVFTNNPMGAAMRGHGVTHTRFAAECQMDMIADELGMDRLEIRMKNSIDNPAPGTTYTTINGVTLKTCGMKEAFRQVAEPYWHERNELPKKEGNISWGVGVSGAPYLTGARQMGHQACAAIIRLCEDGTVNLITGATDCGQGSDTVLAMIAAEELGIPVSAVISQKVDTSYTPADPGSYGSRVTVLGGQAVQKAAQEVKKQLVEVAAQTWKVKPEDVDIRDGMVFVASDPDKQMPFDRMARVACYSGTGAVIMGTGYSTYGLEPLGMESGYGNAGVSYSFTAQTARVGVDLETGQLTTQSFTIASDCGRMLNPLLAEGQIEGGAIQGLGQAIYEDFIMDKGRTLNPTFVDYKMPHSVDIPEMKLIDVETNDPDGPYGAKEASEASHVSTPPAVICAIHDAAGVWIKEQPATPEKIVKALKEKAKEKAQK